LPLLPLTGVPSPYIGGHQAQMCIAKRDTTGTTHTTTFIDIGDGWVDEP